MNEAVKSTEMVDSIIMYIQSYLREQTYIKEVLTHSNGKRTTFMSAEDYQYRLKQIDRVLRYLLDKQAHYLQVIQKKSINAVMING